MFHYVAIERARSQYRNTLALDWYIGECIVSMININNGIAKPTCGCHNGNTI